MKAIYTKLNDTIYKMNMNTIATPMECPLITHPEMDKEYRDSLDKAIIRYNLTTMEPNKEKTNQEKYNDLIDFLNTEKVTQIDTVEDSFWVTIDYSICDSKMKEILHNISILPITANNDRVVALGVTNTNECMYRQVKEIFTKNEIKIDTNNPIGLTKNTNDTVYFNIHDVSIYQDLYPMNTVHPSVRNVPYKFGSTTISDTLESKILVFSSKKENSNLFPPIKFTEIPRTIELSFGIVLSDYTVVYDDENINKILVKNIEEKGQQNPPSGNLGGVSGIPQRYERSTQGTANALLVVEDLYPDTTFDPITMVRKKDVIGDIPDITLGEYVVLVSAVIDPNGGIGVTIVP